MISRFAISLPNCSIVGLFVAISLEHLDLSNNLINAVEGLESLQHLKTLNLENNNISNDSAIRPLSFNT
jgi:Leucine-rich repeat (LRR) protein